MQIFDESDNNDLFNIICFHIIAPNWITSRAALVLHPFLLTSPNRVFFSSPEQLVTDSAAGQHRAIVEALSSANILFISSPRGEYPFFVDNLAVILGTFIITHRNDESLAAKERSDFFSSHFCKKWDVLKTDATSSTTSHFIANSSDTKTLSRTLVESIRYLQFLPQQFSRRGRRCIQAIDFDLIKQKTANLASAIVKDLLLVTAAKLQEDDEKKLQLLLNNVSTAFIGLDASSPTSLRSLICNNHLKWKTHKYPDIALHGFDLETSHSRVLRLVSDSATSRGNKSLNYLVESDPISRPVEHMKEEEASSQKKTIRLLCITYTTSTRHDQVRAILDTWGKRCDGYFASSNASDETISALHVHRRGPESFNNIWQKIRATLIVADKYIIGENNSSSSFDWIFVSGDDTYVLVDSLRAYLESSEIIHASAGGDRPLYLGQPWSWNSFITFNHGGAGYLLNRAALQLLGRRFKQSHACASHAVASMEDVLVSHCLQGAGVSPYDTRDHLGRHRFHFATPGARYLRPMDSIEGFTVGMDSRWNAKEDCCAR